MTELPTRRNVLLGAARCAAMAPFLSLAACGPSSRGASDFGLRGRTMGTTYQVRVSSPPAACDRLALHSEIAAVLQRVNRQMSIWRNDAELARLNAAPARRWVTVSPETVAVVEAAVAQQRRSQGAYDPSVGALVDLWGFGPSRRPRRVPDVREIDGLLQVCGPDAIQWRRSTPALRRMHADVRVDLSSIAQGHAVDALCTLLGERGIDNALIELGGEIRASGRAGTHRSWRVGVDRPMGSSRRPLCVVELSNAAIGTSGVTRHAYEASGQRMAHILDPRSGRPVAHDLLAVSVIAASAMRADADATTLLVLGPEAGAERARRLGLAALFACAQGPDVHVTYTPAFSEHVIGEDGPG